MISSSCVITRIFDGYPITHSYNYSGERPLIVSGGISDMSTYHYLFLFISNMGEGNRENIQYIKIDNCRIIYSSGNSNDLLEKIETIRYLLHGMSEEITDLPFRIIENIQLQFIEGKYFLYLDTINEGDSVEIMFKININHLISNFYLEYAFTIVWEDYIEERHQGVLFFKKESKIWDRFTV